MRLAFSSPFSLPRLVVSRVLTSFSPLQRSSPTTLPTSSLPAFPLPRLFSSPSSRRTLTPLCAYHSLACNPPRLMPVASHLSVQLAYSVAHSFLSLVLCSFFPHQSSFLQFPPHSCASHPLLCSNVPREEVSGARCVVRGESAARSSLFASFPLSLSAVCGLPSFSAALQAYARLAPSLSADKPSLCRRTALSLRSRA